MILVDANILRLPQLNGHVVVHQLVMTEIIFDHFASITQGQNKIPMTEMGIILHDVPQNGTLSDRDHRFGP